ncbi:protein VACUOLELESS GAMETOPHYTES-like isoform X4 [Cryptomeria japonica]|uniref:protein VACUOLELESS GAMETOPHYTES-like isoform X4 n=1 Tax=Cryptomeria japonica TaxID=3369 RepID=UPI0025AC77EA|nr:protein VACUOLELESS GAMETOPHYTES-like isoform X4 [Cryptomeria japonica]
MQQLIHHPSNFAQHISCATANMAEERIIHHRSHPGHWLSLFKYKREFRCKDCGEEGRGNGYGCAVCNFDLHISCATVNMIERKQDIQHPIDPGHWLSYVQYPRGFICNGCGEKGRGNGYGCAVCNFDLHITCAMVNMAEEGGIQHPSHAEHRLSFFKYKTEFKCDSCGEKGRGNGYGCAACEFDMHISCATNSTAEQRQVIEHPINKEHNLSYVRYPRGFICNGCGEKGHGNGYGCAVCNIDLHISCATVNMAEQRPIQHPSHSGHCLSHVRYPVGFKCDGCGEYIHGNGYRCGACNFDLHECCATARPQPDRNDRHRSGRSMALRGGLFLGKLAFGAFTGDPTSIAEAFTDLFSSD